MQNLPQPTVNLSPKDPVHGLLHYLELYLTLEVAASRSPHTQQAKQRDLKVFVEWFYEAKGDGNMARWIRKDTQAYLHTLGKKNRPSTVNRRLATLKHFAKFCTRIGAFPLGDPTERISEVPREPLRPRSLSRAQMAHLYAAADQLCRTRTHQTALPKRDRAILWVMAQTGMRVASLTALDRRHYDGRYLRNVPCKGAHWQDHFLPQAARDALDAWLAQRGSTAGPLFWSCTENRLDRVDITAIFNRIVTTANETLPEAERFKMSPHMLRHTVAQELCDKFGESFAIEKLGHTSRAYIQRYLKRPADIEERMLEEALGR